MSPDGRLGPGEAVVLGADDDLEASVRRHARGRPLLRGFEPPDEPWDLAERGVLAAGEVADDAEAQAALLCAVRGASLVVRLDRTAPWAATFLADLGRLAQAAGSAGESTPDGVSGASGVGGLGGLTEEQQQVLDLLLDGQSIAAAAQSLFLSLRTTNRRVAEARSILGAATTREAVLAYAKLKSGR